MRLYQFGYARMRDRIYMVSIAIPPTVKDALQRGAAVVALESAVITHGLPRDAAVEAIRRQQTACEEEGATAAVVAVWHGELFVGLSIDECAQLAALRGAAKVSPWNLAAVLTGAESGGTTVAATLIAAERAGIRVMATGGIGGVHPGEGADVSADLTELSRRQVCVVCAGPKSILDAAATLERLETLGVPVVGWQSKRLAGFLAATTELTLAASVDTIDGLVALLRRHWAIGCAGVVVSQPLPAELAISQAALSAGEGEDSRERGAERTPSELKRLQERLGRRAVDVNIALLERNARLAARLAVGLASR